MPVLKVIKSSKFDYSPTVLFLPHNKFSPCSGISPGKSIHTKHIVLHLAWCTHFKTKNTYYNSSDLSEDGRDNSKFPSWFADKVGSFHRDFPRCWKDQVPNGFLSFSFAFPYKSQPNLISLEDKLFGLNLPAFKGTGPNLIEVHRNISQEQYKS